MQYHVKDLIVSRDRVMPLHAGGEGLLFTLPFYDEENFVRSAKVLTRPYKPRSLLAFVRQGPGCLPPARA